MNRLTLVLFLLLGTISILAQNPYSRNTDPINPIETTDDDDALYIPESWDVSLDSLMNSWYVNHFVDKNAHPGYHEAVVASDAVYVDRLSRMNNIIELPYNEIVRNCIDLYVDRRRNIVEYMLGLENLYFPMVEQALDAYGLPLELKYLVVIESAMNPVAVSRAGATGMWQFMLGTGKQYGLEINSLVDERRDPVKATYAACEYLKDMYRIYGDWTLVIASYNCGSGNVNKAIRRAGGSTDYWKIYPYLPKETRLYVPLFIAANYVMNYYANHQLRPVQTTLPVATDTVMITQPIHFDQIAEVLKVDKDLIRLLNPQYKRDIIPGNSKPRSLKLPALQAYAYVGLEDSIANYRKDDFFSNRTYVTDIGKSNNEKIIHKVRKGESVLSIGNKYGLAAASIRKWNGLKSNKVSVGKRLVLYIDNGGYTASASTTSPSPSSNYNYSNTQGPQFAQSTPSSSSIRSAINTASSSQPAPAKTTESKEEYFSYKVKSGDNLSTIAQKIPNCSLEDLKKINNLQSTKLKVGQVIKVPKP
ncbi:MAG: transglycosylase SLT domain-containing protein [Candidatus Symbiothrix sp.]|jgi:membrane-bound lytic murein transglycosylase D|nr:transglycosylase SLT domain-containing protein [Candidatus Symbiothrix sp.]